MRRSVFVAGVLSSMGGGCIAHGPEQPFTSLSAASEPLRQRFSRDATKVRVLMLVSPT